jgi:CRP-like cAMP-binding protein
MSQILREHIESVVSLSDSEFEFVLSHFKPRRFRKHQFLVQEGNAVTQIYFIVQGLAKSFYVDEEGREHITQFSVDSYWTTDNDAFYNNTQATINIACLENTESLSLAYEDMEKLCASLNKMEYFFRKKAIADNILLEKRALCLIKNNAADRFHDLLSNYPELVQRVPKTLIASYLGVSRETLSRLLLQ